MKQNELSYFSSFFGELFKVSSKAIKLKIPFETNFSKNSFSISLFQLKSVAVFQKAFLPFSSFTCQINPLILAISTFISCFQTDFKIAFINIFISFLLK
ncbi:MAG: hypothetical protein LBU14_02350 [Candidatus Peribacteria bacterium]|nr:hypothetical protein [Candidatus Peribacteria bacterium]